MKKHIVCLGDSNTHGFCADPGDCADGGDRFNESERWTCLLQDGLGSGYLVLEEGLSSRTTVFPDPLHESITALEVIRPILLSHKPVDLLIIMLGTNDTKARIHAEAPVIARGMGRLLEKAVTVPCWSGDQPNILVICPPHIDERLERIPRGACIGTGCARRSRELSGYLEPIVKAMGFHYLDAQGIAEFNKVDYMHLTRLGHWQLAEALTALVPTLL